MFVLPNDHVGSLIVLFVGLLTFLGFVAIGRVVCKCAGFQLPPGWDIAVQSVTGAMIVSVVIELIAMTRSVPNAVWVACWAAVAIAGGHESVKWMRNINVCKVRHIFIIPFLWLVVMASVIILLISLAPSSKIDELYYHMLLAERIVTDGGLYFYRYPWQSAVLPQMHYQFLGVLPRSIGVPDASNVISWCFFMTLQYWVWQVLALAGVPRWVCGSVAAIVSVGMLQAVFLVTAGSTSYGLLTSAAGVAAAAPGATLRVFQTDSRTRICTVSILCTAAAGTKLTLIPLAVVCMFVALADEIERVRPPVYVLIKWLAFPLLFGTLITPLAVFTAVESGSPLGPVMSSLVPFSSYLPGEMQRVFAETRRVNMPSASDFLYNVLLVNSPLVWAGVAMILFGGSRTPPLIRAYALVLTITQFGLLVVAVHPDIRFIGGYHIGLIPTAIIAYHDHSHIIIMRYRRLITCFIYALTIPWLIGMAYYALPFAATTIGFQSRENFCRQYTAFRYDYLQLDSILPPNATLIPSGIRLNAVYSCRPITFDTRDPLHGRLPYLFVVNNHNTKLPDNYRLGDLVYENPHSVIIAYRRPGVEPRTGKLQVYSLVRHDVSHGSY